ncbi:MAG: calcium-binding protein, partial [Methylovulum sp.]|nr:calcium-binding protein [Methylovulum sp.]
MATNYKFSTITASTPIAYLPTDTFTFDVDSVSAASLVFGGGGASAITITVGSIVITFNGLTDFNAVLKSYFSFADGSQLVFGDGLAGTGHLSDDTAADTLFSTDGSDYLDGLGGGDTVSYANATAAVTVNLTSQGAAQNTIGAGSDKLLNFANLTGSSFNDTLTGDANINTIDGGLGIDTMDGKNGADTYKATAGDVVNDTGTDNVTDTVIANSDYALATGYVALTHKGVENLTLLAGSTAISGTGNEGDNTVTGNINNNVLDGGSAGTDTLVGGAGNDTYIVSHSGVSITELTAAGTDQVISSVDYDLTAFTFVENLRLVGSASAGTGNAGVNTLIGNSQANTLDGAAGADIITDLLGGADTLIGGLGADTLKAGAGDDTLYAGTTSGAGFTSTDSGLDNL